MAIFRKRKISDEEKQQVLKMHGRICYATGHKIPDDSEIEFDHIRAFADNGVSAIENIAPMCQEHNRKKGLLPLDDFRIKLEVGDFFSQEQTLTLKNELEYFVSKEKISDFGRNCYSKIIDENIELEIADKKYCCKLFTCQTSGWKYFYAIVPVEAINSDDDEDGEIGLQPRYLIEEKIFNLYRHFQRHPVLQPSIARLHKNKILVFDGQHKIAAMLWAGKRQFDIKVYVDPDPTVLNTTNIAAHDRFAQTRFYSSIMVSKLGSQFGKQFEDYKNRENDDKKSEYGFVEYLKSEEKLTAGEVNKRFRSFLHDMILDEQQNKITKFVSKSNRGTDEYPITVDMLSKSIFSNFLYQQPDDEDLASEHYKRESEIKNIIELCNILHDEALHAWNSKLGKDNPHQNKLTRIFRSKSMMAWSELLRDTVAANLKIYDADDREKLFYRELTKEQVGEIKEIVQRLLEWSIWDSPKDSEVDRVLSDNKSAVKEWFKEKNLTTGYLLGASS